MFDIHCHLEYMEEPEKVIAEARKRMGGFVSSVADIKDAKKILKIAEKHKGFVFVSLGLHPERVSKYTDDKINEYIEFIRKNKNNIVAIGEVGLDYNWNKQEEERKRTRDVFIKFIRLAKEIDRPLVLHVREAFSDTWKILDKEKPKHVAFHFFTGISEDLRKCIERKYFVSYSTVICRTGSFEKLIAETPSDFLLLDSDAPWVDPAGGKALTNRPWKIESSAKAIAKIKNMDKSEVLSLTEKNARNFFRIEDFDYPSFQF